MDQVDSRRGSGEFPLFHVKDEVEKGTSTSRQLFSGHEVEHHEQVEQVSRATEATTKAPSKFDTIVKIAAWGIVFFAVLAVVLFALMQAGVLEVSLKGVGVVSTEVALYGVLASGGILFITGAVYTVLHISKQRRAAADLERIEDERGAGTVVELGGENNPYVDDSNQAGNSGHGSDGDD